MQLLLHPALLLVAVVSANTLVIGFTSPSSTIRIAILPCLLLLVGKALPTCAEIIHNGPWAAFVGGYLATFVLQYISTALLSRWSFEEDGPSPVALPQEQGTKPGGDIKQEKSNKKRSPRDTFGAHLKFGFLIATSFRYSGTPHEVKNVPNFSAEDRTFIPSRAVFLRQKAKEFFFCYLVLDLLNLGADPAGTDTDLYSPETIPLLTRLSSLPGEQLIIRLFVTLGFGLGVCCFQQGVHSLTAFIDVGLRLSEVKTWRPEFGSLSEAYTVRRFWRLVVTSIRDSDG